MKSLFQLGPVILRTLSRDDVEALHVVRSDPDVARFQGWRPMSREQVAAFIDSNAPWTPLAPGRWGQVAVCRADDGALIGDVGVFVSDTEEYAQFGLSLARHAQGQGFGPHTVRAVTEWLFAKTRIDVVRASTDTRNVACLRALRRVGYEDGEVVPAEYKGEACLEQHVHRHRP